ncbi:MAG: permease-like cell division protein FtsX [Bacteroidota bacterium]
MAFVLFFVGMFAAMLLFGGRFATRIEESIVMKVFLQDHIDSLAVDSFGQWLSAQSYVNQVDFVSKEEANQILMARTGEDVAELMDGANPLTASFNVSLKADVVRKNQLPEVKQGLLQNLLVSDIDYPAQMPIKLRRNFKVITFVVGGIGLLLIFIAFYLIFGTIRLSIFARRLSIRSMQLIGATNAFIRKPFLWTGLQQGSMAGALAAALLFLALLGLGYYLRSMDLDGELLPQIELIGLLSGIVLFGLILGFFGSYFAVNRYLARNLDELM